MLIQETLPVQLTKSFTFDRELQILLHNITDYDSPTTLISNFFITINHYIRLEHM